MSSPNDDTDDNNQEANTSHSDTNIVSVPILELMQSNTASINNINNTEIGTDCIQTIKIQKKLNKRCGQFFLTQEVTKYAPKFHFIDLNGQLKSDFLTFVNKINSTKDPKYDQILTLHETLEVDDSFDTLQWAITTIYDLNNE